MIDKDRAGSAQKKLGEKLKDFDWLRGIGITKDRAGSYGLRVNVQAVTEDVVRCVPSDVDGVHVEVVEVGDYEAH